MKRNQLRRRFVRKTKRPLRHPRRGVVLLMVVSLLVMFLLMAITYAVVSSHYRDAAQSFSRRDFYGDDPRREADLVMHQILAEPSNEYSALSGHSLLNDLYGNDRVRYVPDRRTSGKQVFWQTVAGAGGPLVVVQIEELMANPPNPQLKFSKINGYYGGSVITMLGGPLQGVSSRIAYYTYSQDDPMTPTRDIYRFTIEPFVSGSQSVGNPTDDEFIINGKPFNGVGLGYRQGQYKNDMDYSMTTYFPGSASSSSSNLQAALMPNLSGWHNRTLARDSQDGGMDEPWDTFDYQNVYLALQTSDATKPIMPSYHRQDLCAYWYKRLGDEFLSEIVNSDPIEQARLRKLVLDNPFGADGRINTPDDRSVVPWSTVDQFPQDLIDIANLKRQFVFRPTAMDHPNFPGASTFDTLGGGNNGAPWDVDNDGDGRPDSIWIDPGLPILTAANGRKYKRLVAVMIRDLDGRVNVNAHGNNANSTSVALSNVVQTSLAGTTPPNSLPAGIGYGPSEIQFSNIFNTDANFYTRLMQSRYGSDGVAGISSNDNLSLVKAMGKLSRYDYNQYDNFGSPSDVWGRGACAVDHAGQPIYPVGDPLAQNWLKDADSELTDAPYEINLGDDRSDGDSPFTVAELEGILRVNDVDSSQLSSRLRTLLQSGGDLSYANLVTTVGTHVPASRGAIPSYMRQPSPPGAYQNLSTSILDIAKARIREAVPSATDANVNGLLQVIMPFEFFHGQMFDLNRPFGNGSDDDNNGVVDEPGENGTEAPWLYGPFANRGRPAQVDQSGLFNSDTVMAKVDPHLAARQIFARHLYCLMRLITDRPYENDVGNDIQAKKIAQWAINVVDFRDSDSIMTPFEYDTNPFNGWTVDGDLTTTTDSEREVVWGMEYPEVLITETSAFHDVRAADTDYDDGKHKKTDALPAATKDDHLDQLRIPEGSLFVELYCTRSAYDVDETVDEDGDGDSTNDNLHKLPADVYSSLSSTAPAARRLNLARVTSAGDPVWQLAITKHQNAANNKLTKRFLDNRDTFCFRPHDPNPTDNMGMPITPSLIVDSRDSTKKVEIERYVRFSNAVPAGERRKDTYYNSLNWSVAMSPGQYLVVGPRPKTYLGGKTLTGAALFEDNSPQHISLSATAGVEVFNINGAKTSAGKSIKRSLAMVADMSPPTDVQGVLMAPANDPKMGVWPATERIGVSVTEPLPHTGKYYPFPSHPLTTVPGVSGYTPLDTPAQELPDKPFDQYDDNEIPLNESAFSDSDGDPKEGTVSDCRGVLLMRLANPMQPFNAQTNPYITVDWASIDVTVFNGDDKKDLTNDDADYDTAFATRNRGKVPTDSTVPANDFTNRKSLWLSVTTSSTSDAGVGTGVFFTRNLGETLGYLNSDLDGIGTFTKTSYTGSPQNPFPWLTWNNRLFANPMELLSVPASSADRIGVEFRPRSTNDGTQVYESRINPFEHLLNFFSSGLSTNMPPPETLPHYYRLLDHIETPSPYVGAERWYSPEQTANGSAFGISFPPPYNRLSRFRDPGRVNINTITEQEVWNALTSTFDSAFQGAFFNKFIASRRGYGDNNSPSGIFFDDELYPSVMSNPFRPADTYDLMPLPSLKQNRAIEATLLRSENTAGGASRPNTPLLGSMHTEQYRHTGKHAYIAHQSFAKLSNLVTTNSNCFAVWITTGYFEVEPSPTGVDAGHPDGYALSQELGSDEGKIERHRSFYIIDRSIPVGFEPGQTHNIDRCVLLRRFIE